MASQRQLIVEKEFYCKECDALYCENVGYNVEEIECPSGHDMQTITESNIYED